MICDGFGKRILNTPWTKGGRTPLASLEEVSGWKTVQILPIQQPGETGGILPMLQQLLNGLKAMAKTNTLHALFLLEMVKLEQDLKNNVPRGKGKWTWTLTGILTHTNNQTKVVRKFKKEHEGNYYEVIDDIVDGGEP